MKESTQHFPRNLSAIGKSYRGSLIDNAQRFKLTGGAYESLPAEQEGHFRIESARQLEGPALALLDPNVLQVGVIGATQVLKSVLGDIWTPFVIEHLRRNMAIYFETDPKAEIYADTRLMETIKNHPVISQWSKTVSRHDVTKTEIKIGGKKLMICGMNESNCSTLSWPVIWISEAYQHKSDGLLKKAIQRADRFPMTKKILIESRAGKVGEDLHTVCRGMHRVDLKWNCPFCGGVQIWDFFQRREDNSYAGMIFDDGDDINTRARTARWNCLHCRKDIPDTRDIRQKIMDSYNNRDYKINGVSPPAVCFYLPKESARDNSFYDSALSYLTAFAAKQNGNEVPMEDWWMAERAVFYELRLSQPVVLSKKLDFNPAEKIPNWHHDGMLIDCQKHLTLDTVGTFWFEVYTADINGNSFQLDRGFVDGWEKLDEIQAKWKIKNQHVGIDGKKWTHEILKQVAARRQWVKGIVPYTKQEVYMPVCWAVLMGDSRFRHFPWPDVKGKKQYKVFSYPQKRIEVIVNEKSQRESIPVYMYSWAHVSIADQLHELRIGGEGKPKFGSLSYAQLSAEMQAKEVGKFAYDEQMNSETRAEKNGKGYWEKINSTVQNHYLDLARMRVVQLARNGLAGHVMEAE